MRWDPVAVNSCETKLPCELELHMVTETEYTSLLEEGFTYKAF